MKAIDNIASMPSMDQMAYSVKRHGRDLSNCDSEPVRTPGCVQAHGALLVLRPSDLLIRQVSDNVAAVLGHSIENLLGQPVSTLIGATGEDQLRTLLARNSADGGPLYLLSLEGPTSAGGTFALVDVTVHTSDGTVILEFETTGRTDAASPDYYELVKKTVTRLQSASSLVQFCTLAAEELRELTGMDRVMAYKFHEDGHGEVFAESKVAELSSWIGLHYPAEDIPKPARDMFSKTWIRPIPDMSDALAEMVPLINPDSGKALDMTYCSLRGVSLMCSEYYRNIGVGATLTMSIRRGEQLWGLFSCISYDKTRYLPYQVRAACEFLAQVISLQHNAVEDKEHLAYRLKLESNHQQLLVRATHGGLVALTNGTVTLLDGLDASGAALYHDGCWYCMGVTPEEAMLNALGDWLRGEIFTTGALRQYATACLSRAWPPATRFAAEASGLLAIPLAGRGRDLILWFRPEIMQTINWAGDPHDKIVAKGPNGPRLTPRKSFALFVETVRERASRWKSLELEAIEKLRLQLVEIVIGGVRQRSALHAELTRTTDELNAFNYVATHDLKEPLRGIHQYAMQLTEDAAVAESKDRTKLERVLRLSQRMDSLLNSLLHFSRVGNAGEPPETVAMNDVLHEAIEMIGLLQDDQTEIVIASALPAVRGNRAWCREIFSNLLSNARLYNKRPLKRIKVGAIRSGEIHPRAGCPPGSENHTIYYVTDNGIGIDAKHFKQIFKLFKRLHGRDDYGGGNGSGLTVVRKLVERHHGKVWVDSTKDYGSTFYFTLPGDDNA